ncbi:uncharacterized protein MICPUCDRAFT_67773, partial [Micromonas pusilla CCMP1545]
MARRMRRASSVPRRRFPPLIRVRRHPFPRALHLLRGGVVRPGVVRPSLGAMLRVVLLGRGRHPSAAAVMMPAPLRLVFGTPHLFLHLLPPSHVILLLLALLTLLRASPVALLARAARVVAALARALPRGDHVRVVPGPAVAALEDVPGAGALEGARRHEIAAAAAAAALPFHLFHLFRALLPRVHLPTVLHLLVVATAAAVVLLVVLLPSSLRRPHLPTLHLPQELLPATVAAAAAAAALLLFMLLSLRVRSLLHRMLVPRVRLPLVLLLHRPPLVLLVLLLSGVVRVFRQPRRRRASAVPRRVPRIKLALVIDVPPDRRARGPLRREPSLLLPLHPPQRLALRVLPSLPLLRSLARHSRALFVRLWVEGPYKATNVGVEFIGVRSGVERRRGVSGLKARGGGRRDAPGKVLKERRSPRRWGRMGTSVNHVNAPCLRALGGPSPRASPPPRLDSRARAAVFAAPRAASCGPARRPVGRTTARVAPRSRRWTRRLRPGGAAASALRGRGGRASAAATAGRGRRGRGPRRSPWRSRTRSSAATADAR